MSTLGPVIGQVLDAPIVSTLTGGGGVFHPASLFAGGVKGIALDLSSASGLYQDSARTMPVTAAGQPIGSPSDLSGNGAHPTQATAGSRPTWQTTHALFDGTNDFWVTPAIDFSGTNKMTIVASVRPNASAGAAFMLVELSASTVSNTGSFHLTTPNNAAGSINAARRGSGSRGDRSTPAMTLPANILASTTFDLAGTTHATENPYIRINGVAQTLVDGGSADTGGGNFGNYQLYIGMRGGATLPYGGRIHRIIVIGKTLSAAELALSETWCGQTVS